MSITSITRSYKFVGEKLRADLSNWYEWSDQIREYLVLNGAELYITKEAASSRPAFPSPSSGTPDADLQKISGQQLIFDRNVSIAYGMIKQWVDHEVIDKYFKDKKGKETRDAANAWKTLEEAYSKTNKLRTPYLLSELTGLHLDSFASVAEYLKEHRRLSRLLREAGEPLSEKQ